jgi:hypothetical protein
MKWVEKYNAIRFSFQYGCLGLRRNFQSRHMRQLMGQGQGQGHTARIVRYTASKNRRYTPSAAKPSEGLCTDYIPDVMAWRRWRPVGVQQHLIGVRSLHVVVILARLHSSPHGVEDVSSDRSDPESGGTLPRHSTPVRLN